MDRAGDVYVADTGTSRIRKVTPTGVVTALAGYAQGNRDGIGTEAWFNFPRGVAVDATGDNIYVADTGNHTIRKVTAAGEVTTLAGSGTAGDQNGTGTSASFNMPRSVTVDSSGNVYVADFLNHRIRKVTAAGVVSILAGSTLGYQDGANASFNFPMGVALDGWGNLYVADSSNNRIRKIATLPNLIYKVYLPFNASNLAGW